MLYHYVCEQGSSKINFSVASLSYGETPSGWPLQVLQYQSYSQLRVDKASSPSMRTKVGPRVGR